jgi:cell fate regulator YaaT (PSP1 superfamily)
MVRLGDNAKASPFDAGELCPQIGDKVVVETEQGLVAGKVTNRCQQCLSQETLRRIIRTFDTNDVRQESRNQAREAEAFIFCRERIEARQLPMKLIGVEYLHGGNKATFYFTAENRIDFRELVKDLAQRFHTRIIMRQIGVRDESKMLGGIGSCGCELCCACWLSKFEPVSIRMAKDQNLVLNPQKVSGQCGRLKCCLTYEERQYQEARKKLPRPGRSVQTPDGLGRVHELDVLRCIVRVRFEDGAIKSYPVDRLDPVQMSELDAMEDGIDSVAIESDA